MTEQEYVDLSDLQRVRIAIKVLSEIVTENSKIIKEKDYKEVVSKICDWADELSNQVQVNVI